MAVQARHYSHDLLAPVAGGSLFLVEYAGCTSVPAPARIGDTTTTGLSELAWCNNNNYGFLPRKRPRLEAAPVPAGGFLEDLRVGTPPACTERLLPVPPFVEVWNRAVGSDAASTSGRAADDVATVVLLPELLSSWTHRHGVEIDALVTLEAERMRAALEDVRRRHARTLLAAASRRLRASETDLERALRRNAELEDKARQAGAECQAWMGVARSHEAVAAGLRGALDQLLMPSPSPCGAAAGAATGGEAKDAQSCCFEAAAHATEDDDGACASWFRSLACKSCGGGDACMLLLPCRHLCLCRVCEAAVDACPVCATAKNGSLHALFS